MSFHAFIFTCLDSPRFTRKWKGRRVTRKMCWPPFVPSTGPPISIRYPLKAALWEKKGNGSSWYFHRLCLDNPPGYASTSWNSCPWSISLSIYTHLDGKLNMVEPRSLFFIASLWHVNILLTCFNILQNQKMYALKFGHLGAPFCRFRSFLPKELCHHVFGALESLWKLIHLTCTAPQKSSSDLCFKWQIDKWA